MTIQDQCLDDFANNVIAFDNPKDTHSVGLGRAAGAIGGRVDVDTGVLFKELTKRAVGKIEYVTAAHAKQPFYLVSFNGCYV